MNSVYFTCANFTDILHLQLFVKFFNCEYNCGAINLLTAKTNKYFPSNLIVLRFSSVSDLRNFIKFFNFCKSVLLSNNFDDDMTESNNDIYLVCNFFKGILSFVSVFNHKFYQQEFLTLSDYYFAKYLPLLQLVNNLDYFCNFFDTFFYDCSIIS